MMRAIVQAGALRSAVNKAVAALNKSNWVPVLSMVRIECAEGRLSVSGTNQTMVVTATCPVHSGEDGAFCVPGVRLARFLRHLPADEMLSIRHVGDRAQIDMALGRLSLMTIPADEFPTKASIVEPFGPAITMTAPDLLAFLRRLLPFVCTEETRYYLNGVCLHAGPGGKLVGAATDGRHLARVTLDADAGTMGDLRAIVPNAAVRWIVSHLGKTGDAKLSFDAGKHCIRIEAEGTTIVTDLVDGRYPDYERVIPATWTKRVKLDRAKTLSTLTLLNSLLHKGNGCRIVEQADGRLAVVARNIDSEELVLALPMTAAEPAIEAARFDVSMNPRLLTTALLASCGEAIWLAASPGGGPVAITGDDDPGAVSVVMPMRGIDFDIALPDGAVAC